MPHQDVYRNGVKLASVTQIPAVVDKVFLDNWRIKLCHCKAHAEKIRKTPFKEKELEVIQKLGPGYCGYVYGEQIKDDAAELGTEVHTLIDNWFKEKELKGTKEAMIWAQNIIALYQQHDVKPYIVTPEELLIDEESGLTGSIDHVIIWEGRPELADLKFKNRLDEFTGVQGWLYRYLIRRKYNLDLRWMRVIWGKKESKNHNVEDILIDLDKWENASKACVTIWNVLNPKRQVRVHE